MISDGARGEASALAPAWRGTNDWQAGVDRANGLGGGHRVCLWNVLMPKILRHGLIAFGSALWFAGLWAQFHSLSAAATYVVISLLMVLVVAL